MRPLVVELFEEFIELVLLLKDVGSSGPSCFSLQHSDACAHAGRCAARHATLLEKPLKGRESRLFGI